MLGVDSKNNSPAPLNASGKGFELRTMPLTPFVAGVISGLKAKMPATDVQKIYLVPSQLPLRPLREREGDEVASQECGGLDV